MDSTDSAVEGYADLYKIPKELLICGICEHETRQPKYLPCVHSFCQTCLGDLVSKSNAKPGEIFPCPSCEQMITIPPEGVAGFPDQVFVEKLLDTVGTQLSENKKCDLCRRQNRDEDAVVFCFEPECDYYMCKTHHENHTKVKANATHNVVKVDTLKKDLKNWGPKLRDAQTVKCKQHHKKMQLVCKADKVLVCDDCLEGDHFGHETLAVQDYLDDIKPEVSKLVDGYDKTVSWADETLTKQEKDIEEKVNKSSEQAERELEKWRDAVKNKVDAHFDKLKATISERKDQKMEKVKGEKEAYEGRLQPHRSARDLLKYLLQFGKPAEILDFNQQYLGIKDAVSKKNVEEPRMNQPDDVRFEDQADVANALRQAHIL